jgi:flagellar basal-body rod protein FlgB
MDLEGIPLLSMLKSRMNYLDHRQQVIAQNVANADTPGFTPKDLKPFTSQAASGGRLALTPVAQTQPGHMSGLTSISLGSSSAVYKPVASPDDETKLDGNQVVLEEQMMKMNDTRSDYDTAVSLYQKAMSFISTAAKEPGK